MFCFHCGTELTERDGVLYCEPSGMAVSERLRRRLAEGFVARTGAGRRKPDGPPRSTRPPYFCPRCGVAMVSDGDDHAVCPECRRVLDPFIYEIVELHPHQGA